MNVALPPELEKIINEKVDSGLYASASEVVGEGLRLLKEQDELRKIRLDELRREVQVGLKEAETRELVAAEEAFSKIRKRHKQRVASKR
jgi:antitoxin ParD1/3/4